MCCLSPLGKVTLGCALFSFMSSGIIQFGLMSCTLTTVQEHFVLSYTEIAVAIVCFQVSQIIASFGLPHIEQKWPSISAEMICGIGMVLCIVGALLYGLAQGYAMLIIAQLINGVGAGSVYIFMPSMFARLVTTQAMISLAVAKSFALTPIGIVVASLSCSAAVEHWRWLYVIYGIALVIPAAVFISIAIGYKKEDPRHKIAAPPTFGDVKNTILKRPVTMFAMAGVTCTAFLVAATSTFLPAYIEEHLNQTKRTASLVLAATVPAVAIGTMIGGKLSEWMGWTHKKLLYFVFGASLTAFIILMIWLPADIRLLGVVIFILVALMFTVFLEAGPAVAVIAQFLPRHMVTHGQSILNIITRAIGGVGGPLLMAAILDSGLRYNIALFVISWVMLIGTVTFGLSAYLCPDRIEIDHQVGDDDASKEIEDGQQSREPIEASTSSSETTDRSQEPTDYSPTSVPPSSTTVLVEEHSSFEDK